MRKLYLMIFSLFLIVIVINPVTGNEAYKEINSLELKKWMDKDDMPLLVNSLSPIEFGEEYIPGSVSIPMELMPVSQLMPADFNASIVFYSYGPGCMKSKSAAATAVKMGYKNIYWFQEGIKGWKKAEYGTQYNLKLPKEPLPPKEPSELFKQLQNKETVVLVDIRDEGAKKEQGIISGITIHLPLYRLHNLYGELPRNKELIVYDVNGQQAPTACRYLFKRHFNRVTWLKGGMKAWKEEKLPVK